MLLISSFEITGVKLKSKTVLTGSMEPAISIGSIVFVYPQVDYVVGDVVTYKRKASPVKVPITHRIVSIEVDEVEGLNYTTKGDANDYADTVPIKYDEIYGKVIFQIPFLGKILEFVKTPWGLTLLIVVPTLFVIVDEVKKVRTEMRLIRGNKEEEELLKKKNE